MIIIICQQGRPIQCNHRPLADCDPSGGAVYSHSCVVPLPPPTSSLPFETVNQTIAANVYKLKLKKNDRVAKRSRTTTGQNHHVKSLSLSFSLCICLSLSVSVHIYYIMCSPGSTVISLLPHLPTLYSVYPSSCVI